MKKILGSANVEAIVLPAPTVHSTLSVEAALMSRQSVRSYTQQALSLDIAGQLLWAAQGVTSSRGRRTAPSAGALYPLEIDLVAGDVANLAAGVYRYQPDAHALQPRIRGDLRDDLRSAAIHQHELRDGRAVIVISAVYARTAAKYRGRAERYVHMEAGHAAENVCLQVRALELGTVVIGAFDDPGVIKVLELAENEAPLVLLPIGYPA